MPRDTSPAFNDAAEEQVIYPALFVEIEFEEEFVRLWTGYGEFTLNSEVYQGTGDLGSVSPVTESSDVNATGLTMGITGLPSSILSAVLNDARQGKDVTLHLGLFDSAGILIDSANDVFKGFLDVPSVKKSGSESSIKITAENRLIELQKTRERRYTDQDQQDLFPGDIGLQYINALQAKEIVWGSNAKK